MYLLPVPQKLTQMEGTYILGIDNKIVIDSSCGKEVFQYAKLLQDSIYEMLGYRIDILRGACEELGIFLKIDARKEKEAYQLDITKEGIFIVGGSFAGVLYGIQTVRQIIQQEGAVVPYLNILDYPSIENRGFYHDATRGRVPKLDFLKKLADKLSFYKMNQLQLYVEHTYLFQNLSEMWRDDTPLTAEEIMELDEYCANLNIELVPSMASFGHLYKLLNTKTHCHLCELDGMEDKEFSFVDRMAHHTVDVSNPLSIQLIKQMIEEYMSLFSSQHFNLCADETFDLGKGKSKELADRVGTRNMYISFVKELCEFIVEHGKRPMFWGDIILGFPDAIKELPEETICLNWGYAPNQGEEGTKALSEAGATQYVCPGVGGWNMLINLTASAYNNITRMCSYAHKYNALGVLNTDWGDFGHINHPEFSYIGMIYGAVFSWNKQEIEFEEVNRQISLIEYTDKSETFVSIVAQLCTKNVYGWDQAVRFKESFAAKRITMSDLAKEELTEEKEKRNSHLVKANDEIDRFSKELYQLITKLDSEKRDQIYPYLLLSEAMTLSNLTAGIIGEQKYQKAFIPQMDAKEVAVKIEKWFFQYKELWRRVSKESEMVQIQDVVFWYADLLRSK